MNVIIVAALALLVLVIVSVIFMSRSSTFVIESRGCESSGGTCVDDPSECPAGTKATGISSLTCTDSSGEPNGRICCIAGE